MPAVNSPTFTVDSKTYPLVANTTFYVGKVYTFGASQPPEGRVQVAINGETVYWPKHPWTPTLANAKAQLVIITRMPENTTGRTEFNVRIAGAPNVPTKPNTDTEPVPNVPPVKEEQTTPTPAKRAKIGMVALSAVDPVAKVVSDLWPGVTKTAAEAYQAIGVVLNREWHTLGSVPGFKGAKKWIDAGIPELAYTLNYGGSELPTPEWIKKQTQAFIDAIPADVRKAMKFIVVGNEPGIGEYWRNVGANKKGSTDAALKNFVTLFLNPAYEVLKAAGFVVAVGGFNGAFADQFKVVRDAGGKFDLIDIHPYQRSTSAVKSEMAQLVELNTTKAPLVSTEWNVFLGDKYRTGEVTTDRVIEEMNSQHAVVSPLFDYLAYFVSYRDEKWTTGVFGALVPDGKGGYSTSPFYNRYLYPLANPAALLAAVKA